MNVPLGPELADGVVYVDGQSAPEFLNDLLQQLFNRFYVGTTTVNVNQPGAAAMQINVQVSVETAQAYLGRIRALFAFDDLPFDRQQMQRLQDILSASTVLVTTSTSAPDTFTLSCQVCPIRMPTPLLLIRLGYRVVRRRFRHCWSSCARTLTACRCPSV